MPLDTGIAMCHIAVVIQELRMSPCGYERTSSAGLLNVRYVGGGFSRQFSLIMDARSIITYPSFPNTIEKGWIEVQGIAWSGRGKITGVEVSTDDGRSWQPAALQEPVFSKAHARFRHLFHWHGKETVIMSRAIDETGYVQPSRAEWIAARGPGSGPYHRNPITGWRLQAGGDVIYRVEDWA